METLLEITKQNYAALSKLTGEHKPNCYCSMCDAVHDYEVENNLIDGYDADYETTAERML